jgi:hypothetical protein
MKRFTHLAAGALVLCAATTGFAQGFPSNGFLGLYSDAAGTICDFSGAGVTTVHLIATTAGGSAGGITGAEFRIEIGNPTGYLFNYSGPSGATVIGSPVDDTPADNTDPKGVNIAFACKPGPPPQGMAGDRIDMGTLTIINLGTGGPTTLKIKEKTPPSNISLAPCPLFTECDDPAFTAVCMTIRSDQPGLTEEPVTFCASVGGAPCVPYPTCGFVGVESSTWSRVKAVYR